jgi:hypothetical protein
VFLDQSQACQVEIDHLKSSSDEISYGFPQGAILSPILCNTLQFLCQDKAFQVKIGQLKFNSHNTSYRVLQGAIVSPYLCNTLQCFLAKAKLSKSKLSIQI